MACSNIVLSNEAISATAYCLTPCSSFVISLQKMTNWSPLVLFQHREMKKSKKKKKLNQPQSLPRNCKMGAVIWFVPSTLSVFKSTHVTSLALQLPSVAALTVRALLGTGPQEQLGHGHVVGHDGDVEGQQALAVGGVEVQLLQTVLGKEQLHQVQLLVLDSLEQGFVTLQLRQKDASETAC